MSTENGLRAVAALLAVGGALMLVGLGSFVLFDASESLAFAGVYTMAACYIVAALILIWILAQLGRRGLDT